MCVIVYKPQGKDLPNDKILKKCWNTNPDGAGYMFPNGKEVIIKKGFMKYKEFIKSLKSDYKANGKLLPFVLHFRIETQGGVNKSCTHPFPLSKDMEDLRKLNTKCKIGVAHNGIIELTTEHFARTITYSDTMKFITDYLSLIIKDNNFYKDKDTVKLIDRLVDGRLAIMDNDGHTTLIGQFEEKDGIYYSNLRFEEPPKKYYTSYGNSCGLPNRIYDSWGSECDYYERYYEDTYFDLNEKKYKSVSSVSGNDNKFYSENSCPFTDKAKSCGLNACNYCQDFSKCRKEQIDYIVNKEDGIEY